MKHTLYFILSMLFASALSANGVHDKAKRCKVILAPFTENQSLEERVASDLIQGIWSHEGDERVTFYRFNEEGHSEVIREAESGMSHHQYDWLVMQIGEVVYLRMDGGSVEDDHLYTIKQNCEGIILRHAHSGEITLLKFEGNNDPGELLPFIEEISGDWYGVSNPNGLQLRLSASGQYDFIYQDHIESGYWSLFPENHYLLLQAEGDAESKVINVKHLDFMNMDITLGSEQKHYALEKKQFF